jgi:hypothetical protein
LKNKEKINEMKSWKTEVTTNHTDETSARPRAKRRTQFTKIMSEGRGIALNLLMQKNPKSTIWQQLR